MTHRTLWHAFAPLDTRSDGTQAQAKAAVHQLIKLFMTTTLASLWQTPNLVAAAHFLANRSDMPFAARVP